MTKALFLTFGDERTPSSRYRVFQYLEGLQTYGWECKVLRPRRGEASWRTALRGLREIRADVIFLQKRLFPAPFFHLLSVEAKGRLIYDFDDALFLHPRGENEKPSHRRSLARLQRSLSHARIVIAGNAFLAEYARKFNPRVEILPTPVDLTRHPRRPAHMQQDTQVIGWVGTSTNHHYLQSIGEALRQLSAKRPTVLRVVSDRAFQFPGVAVENVTWQPEKEAVLLHGFDVGLMPLYDDDWSRGKCAFKALQYMAVGVPVVCSPVGANTEVMQDGAQGFFASTTEEWIVRLDLLLEDAALRERMGNAGRETVAQRYSVEVTLPRLVELLQEVANL